MNFHLFFILLILSNIYFDGHDLKYIGCGFVTLCIINEFMQRIIIYCLSILFIICLYTRWAAGVAKIHNFQDKCFICHINIPDENNTMPNLTLVNEIDKVCSNCHFIDKQKSHPIKVKPTNNIPLTAHLDKDGLITCTTCHDVHKEDKTSNKSELSGLLWGHINGRMFCALCHNKNAQDAGWRHQDAIPYAHSNGKITQNPSGSILDKFSTECLSCHDGTISKFPDVSVKQGLWQHSIGMSHPIGVDYPHSADFTYPESLPKEIKLFDGKVGCLSCHEVYNSNETKMLAMNNKGSRLCLICHKK